MVKYEYKVEVIAFSHKASIEKAANKLGQEGWEVCGFDDGYIIFKRPIE